MKTTLTFLCWIATALGSLLGGAIVVLSGVGSGEQGLQTIAFAIACAVIPYCLARAVQEIFSPEK
jgi:hypothetical protein